MPVAGDIPGVKKLPRPDGTRSWFWVASQLARKTKGFKPRTRFLWRGAGEPASEDLAIIASECGVLTSNLRAWQTDGKIRLSRRVRAGTVYFIRNADGAIKIGFSRDAKKRIRRLQGASSASLELLGTLAGSILLEGELHHRFRRFRIRGEWFLAEQPLLDFIANETVSVPSAKQEKAA